MARRGTRGGDLARLHSVSILNPLPPILSVGGTDASISNSQELRMSPEHARAVAAAGLVLGAVLGMGGTFAPSAELRGLMWATDGVALVVGSALLAVHHFAKAATSWRRAFWCSWRARR
jgi:hypothetical protein